MLPSHIRPTISPAAFTIGRLELPLLKLAFSPSRRASASTTKTSCGSLGRTLYERGATRRIGPADRTVTFNSYFAG